MFTNAFGKVTSLCNLSLKEKENWYSDCVIAHFMMLETVLGSIVKSVRRKLF